MLDYLLLGGVDLLDYTVGAGHRDIARVNGLIGLAQPRGDSSPKTEQHGSYNRSRFTGSKIITIEGECWGTTIEDAYEQFEAVASAFYATLTDPAGKLLAWRRAGATASLRNLIKTPTFEYGGVGDWTVNAIFGITVDDCAPSAVWAASGAGAHSLHVKVTKDATGTGRTLQLLSCLAADVLTKGIPVTPSVGYAAAVRINIVDAWGAAGARLRFRWYDAAGNLVGTSTGPTLLAGATGTAQLVGPDGDSTPDLAHFVQLQVDFQDSTTSGDAGEFYIDAVQFHTEDTVPPLRPPEYYSDVYVPLSLPAYFDGDSDGASWDGEPDASSSSYAPAGSDMQALVKLASPLTPPLEGGAAMLVYQAQVEQMDPRAYAQFARREISDELAASGAGLTFPFGFPLGFDESSGGSVNVENLGNIESPPAVRIYGPVTSPRYVLGSSGEAVKITGEVGSGDYLEIDHAKRTVKLNGSTLRMNLLDAPNSTFFDVPPGTDEIRLLAQNFGAGAHVEVELRDAYSG